MTQARGVQLPNFRAGHFPLITLHFPSWWHCCGTSPAYRGSEPGVAGTLGPHRRCWGGRIAARPGRAPPRGLERRRTRQQGTRDVRTREQDRRERAAPERPPKPQHSEGRGRRCDEAWSAGAAGPTLGRQVRPVVLQGARAGPLAPRLRGPAVRPAPGETHSPPARRGEPRATRGCPPRQGYRPSRSDGSGVACEAGGRVDRWAPAWSRGTNAGPARTGHPRALRAVAFLASRGILAFLVLPSFPGGDRLGKLSKATAGPGRAAGRHVVDAP